MDLNEIRRSARSLARSLGFTVTAVMGDVPAESVAGEAAAIVYLPVLERSVAAGTNAALFLGAVGVYGVTSYAVDQRGREIGIRMALGAPGEEVRRMVLLEGAALALGGIAAGVVAALALTRFLGALLHEVSPTDPLSIASAALLLLAIALLASWLPARRAAGVNPVIALRAE